MRIGARHTMASEATTRSKARLNRHDGPDRARRSPPEGGGGAARVGGSLDPPRRTRQGAAGKPDDGVGADVVAGSLGDVHLEQARDDEDLPGGEGALADQLDEVFFLLVAER